MAISPAAPAAPPNKAPSVSITSPTSGATFTVGTTITISANASDSDGTIAKVDFYRAATTLLGTRTAPPYSIAWTNATAGAHSLTAVATDNSGATKASSAVNISVTPGANIPPSVTMVRPANGTIVAAPATLPLEAAATDNDGSVAKVEFIQNGNTLAPAITAPPYTTTLSGLAQGSYAFAARATDSAGATTTSTAVNITVGPPNKPPLVVLTAPIPCTVYDAPASIVLTADAMDPDGSISKVEFLQGASIIGSTTSAPYSSTWTNVAPGTYTLAARAIDNLGTPATSTPVTITVVDANQPPAIVLTAPANGATFTAPTTVDLAASASDSDGSIAKVEFFAGTTLLATRVAPPYTFTWTNVPAGSYTLTARATDNRGATTTCNAVNVVVSNAPPNNPPSVALTSPRANAQYVAPAIVDLVADASDSDGSISKVDFFAGGLLVGTATTSPYRSTWANAPAGAHVLVARATDNAGAVSTSLPVTIAIDGPPVVSITAPADGTVYSAPGIVDIVLRVTDPDGTLARIELIRDGSVISSPAVPPNVNDFTLSYHWWSVPAGTYVFTARGVDTEGGTTLSTPVRVIVHAPPSVVLTSPANGGSYRPPATIALGATVVDGGPGVASVAFYAGATLIGTVNAAPFTLAWSNVPAGSYVVSAVVTDSLGYSGTSESVVVTVAANLPPAVILTHPIAGTTFHAPNNIELKAAASDSDGAVVRVEFFSDGILLGTSTTPPHRFVWDSPPAGQHAITARATDNLGGTAVSAPVLLTVSSNRPPMVSLSATSDGRVPAAIALSAAASDLDGVVSIVELFQGSTLVATRSTPPYSVMLNDVAAGTYTFTARATDNADAITVSTPVNVTVTTQALSITGPSDGATIGADTVLVKGTIQAPIGSGVVVNGIVAAVDGNGNYYANAVPLDVGSNPITVELNMPDGHTMSRTITVTSGGPAPVKVTASPTSGVSPLTVTFDVSALSGTVVQKVEIDWDGNGTIDATLTQPDWTQQVTYTGVGAFPATVRITDSAGNVFTETVQVVTIDAAQLDQNLRAIWARMTSALAAGDKATAMQFLNTAAKKKYEPVFDTLVNEMAQIVARLSSLTTMVITNALAEYAINQNVDSINRLTFVYFLRDADGIWRIDSM